MNVSEPLKGALPNFIPGLGTLYVDPSKLPEGPFLAYDKAGNLVKVVFMVLLKKLNESQKYVGIGTQILRALGVTRIDHVNLIPSGAHPWVNEPHYHLSWSWSPWTRSGRCWRASPAKGPCGRGGALGPAPFPRTLGPPRALRVGW